MKKLLNGVFFTAVAINPQDDGGGVRRMATAHLQPVISVLRQFDGESAPSDHDGVPHMRLDDEISVATTNNLTQAGSEGMAHTDGDDGGKENTTWVSTVSGVHDNACLSKGIVVLLTNLDMNKVMPLIQLRQQLRLCNDAS